MGRGPSASERLVPASSNLQVVARAARDCTACPLHRHATQTVFGEGPVPAAVFLVGEQPGDVEDRTGRPFVGPAGRVLDEALEEAGLDRASVYVTNVVKHFKFSPRGKRRIHDKPNLAEMNACRGWLEAELRLVQPEIIVCLGATAARAFLGAGFRLTRHRGELLNAASPGPILMATYHPSALLRMPTPEARHEGRRRFAEDLSRILPALGSRSMQAAKGRDLAVPPGSHPAHHLH